VSLTDRGKTSSEQRVIATTCTTDCGGRCLLKVHVKDGAITRIETDDGEEPQLRACLRGRAWRQRVYSPDRVRYPLKRVGPRGGGQFERISWDEALDTVATKLKRVKEMYGPAAVFLLCHSGSVGALHSARTVQRLLNMFGGATMTWGAQSFYGSIWASRVTLGSPVSGNTRDDLLNSRLIIMWGWNPANSVWMPLTSWYLAQAREAGTKIVCVDPRHTESAATLASEWIPIRPGSDAAALIAMAYVMVKENLHDQRFLDTYTVGFDRFKDYVLGLEDGTPKTPAWAEPITGVPAATIEKLAREYATAKPAALIAGWAPGRTAMGEQYARAAITLAAMTGNIGIHGGNAGGFETIGVGLIGLELPTGEDPWRKVGTGPAGGGQRIGESIGNIHVSRYWDALIRGKAGGYPADIKLLYIVAGNPLVTSPNTRKGVSALQDVEFIVVHDPFLTETARFADIVLPANTHLERNDLGTWMVGQPYFMATNQVIEPLYESKTDFQICCELAPRLGISHYSDKTEAEWLKEIAQATRDMPDYETLRHEPVHRIALSEPYVAFRSQIADHKPFRTPSGKIEIYSQTLADMNNPHIPPIPRYAKTWESGSDPLVSRYPLQLITSHPGRRNHSQFENVPWLAELYVQAVTINSDDARMRGIRDGDMVKVYNDRGTIVIPSRVTQRIMPGVVDIPEGGPYKPDENGVDRGGCCNVLTRDDHSPVGSFSSNSTLVQVEKA